MTSVVTGIIIMSCVSAQPKTRNVHDTSVLDERLMQNELNVIYAQIRFNDAFVVSI